MKIKSHSYPDKIRRIASELKRMGLSPEVDSSRNFANSFVSPRD